MINHYETTFIVDAHLSTEQIEATTLKFTQLIEKNGGKINQIDRWGKRRLAYEIAKKQYGFYVYVRFEAEGPLLKTLEREYKLNDSILRFLTVRIPKVVLKEESTRKQEPKMWDEQKESDGFASEPFEEKESLSSITPEEKP